MDIRKETIQFLYSTMTNESLCKDLINTFNKAVELCDDYFPRKKEDDYMDALVNLEYEAFCAGANMVLDVISGGHITK